MSVPKRKKKKVYQERYLLQIKEKEKEKEDLEQKKEKEVRNFDGLNFN